MIESAGSIQTIKSFLDGDEFRAYLAGLDLDAARDAISKAKRANNPDGQIWSAVNHLESAHQKNRKTYNKGVTPLLPAYETMEIIDALSLDMEVLCLMAMCYRLLRENRLCQETLDEVGELHKRHAEAWKFVDDTYPKVAYKVITIFADPRTYASLFRRYILGKQPPVGVSPEQLRELRSKLVKS